MTLENRKKIIHTQKNILRNSSTVATHLTPYSHHKQSTTDLYDKGMRICLRY